MNYYKYVNKTFVYYLKLFTFSAISMKSKTDKKKSVKPVSKEKHVAKKNTKAASKPVAKKEDKKSVKKEKEVVKKAPVKIVVPKPKTIEDLKREMAEKEKLGPRRGRKKKDKGAKDDGDLDGKPVIEDVSNLKPVEIRSKKKSPKEKAKERILAKLREKAEQELHSRNYLPSKKKKYTLEYLIKSSPVVLFDFLATSSGLALWFADAVDDHLDYFTFTWDGSSQQAELIEYEDLESVKYRWVDNQYDEWFEFRIATTEITGDTVLLITDFADQNELKDVQFLWDNQIKALLMRLGLAN